MGNKYIIGIDGGSQNTKMAIYGLDGGVVCEASEHLAPMYMAPGKIFEHPEDDLWTSLCVASKKLMSSFNGNISDLEGIGLCSIRFCRALIREDGRLAQPVLSWMDARLFKPHEWVNPDVKYVTTASGYLTLRLTGNFVDSAANYLGVWPLDMEKWDYYEDDSKLEENNLKRENLFKLLLPGELLGYVSKEAALETGFPEGLPVFATANDKAAEALGVGCIDGDTAVVSLGTYIASMTPGPQNRPNTANVWTNLACIPWKYLYESGGIRRGMWILSWFISMLGEEFINKAANLGISPEDLLSEEAKMIPPGCDGLIVLPHWLATMDYPYRKGMMLGFDARHTRGHIFRSIMESIALTMKIHLEAMCSELGQKPKRVIISGGGSSGSLFMQIFADVLDMPVMRAAHGAGAGLGSAICAAVGLEIYGSFEEAAGAMVKYEDVFMPDPKAAALYRTLNDEVFGELTDLGDKVFKKTYDIFH